ncbi:MAG: dUTP diphosphatase [Clostridia bacterium]|nr:dUTP diphosphatase [Clostridia bacterium]
MKIPVKKLHPDAVLPTFGSAMAAGADLYSVEEKVIEAGRTVFVPTGLSMELPAGYGGFIFARSGLACKRDLAPANKVGVIDADYRGEIIVALHNHGQTAQTVEKGERIAQMVVLPFLAAEYFETDELSDTDRGNGGFGSTGKK